MIEDEGQRLYVLIKFCNTFIYDHTLHRKRKHFCRHFVETFSPEKILKCHIKSFFKIDGKQRIKIP